MTKVVVEIELDNESYRREYGPGSEHWKKYMYDSSNGPNGEWIRTPKADSEYKAMEGKALYDSLIEVLSEGFYDWDKEGWMKMKIDGKVVRQCCKSLEGEEHQNYCEAGKTA